MERERKAISSYLLGKRNNKAREKRGNFQKLRSQAKRDEIPIAVTRTERMRETETETERLCAVVNDRGTHELQLYHLHGKHEP